MKKIYFLQPDSNHLQSRTYLKKYFKYDDLEIEFEDIQDPDELKLLVVKNIQSIDVQSFRISYDFSQEIITQISTLPQEVRIHQVADSFYFENEKWWPKLIFMQTVRDSIVHSLKGLNNRQPGYILGDGLYAQLMAHVLFDLGFQKIILVGYRRDNLGQAQHLQQYFLGMDLRLISAERLNLEASEGSVLINTLIESDIMEILEEVVYFNFLNNQAAVIDIHLSSKKSELIHEAELAHFKTLSGQKIHARLEFNHLVKMGLVPEWKWSDFYDVWKSSLKG